MKINNKVFLYTGLTLLFISLLIRGLGVTTGIWLPVFCVAILLKVIFLYNVFNTKGFKMSLWLGLILIGVALILISMIFRYLYPITLLRNILFYAAITFKVAGLVVMIKDKMVKKG
ncbi:hypothetical protein LJC06_04805 [Bacteroidales bacterium OttesenSCG-928-I14]|nr:hypothetical protein [Bacteroidales bacterium OttesenSCG-928-I14]